MEAGRSYLHLKIASQHKAECFMTREEYLDFSDEFQRQVRPELDRQTEISMRAKEEARNNLLY